MFCCGATPVHDEPKPWGKPQGDELHRGGDIPRVIKKSQVLPAPSSPSRTSLLGTQHGRAEQSSPSAYGLPTSNTSITSGSRKPSHITGDTLRDLGFSCYSAASAQSNVPAAVLVLEPAHDLFNQPMQNEALRLPEEGRVSLQAHHRSKPVNNLVPAYVNKACCNLFGILSHKDYVLVIRRLLQRDPLLTFALQKGLGHMKQGEDKAVSHVTPDPSGQTSTLFGMRITPCIWDASPPSLTSLSSSSMSSSIHPALLVEHNVPYDAAEVMPRLMRDYAVLSHVPAILTLIDFNGRTIWQNASSLAYMGDLLSVKHDNPLADGLLRCLFMYNLAYLDQLIEEVHNGQEWQGVVQVPCNLRQIMAAQARESTQVRLNDEHPAHGRLTGTGLGDDADVDFQIGNDFSTLQLADKHKRAQQKQASTFLAGRPIAGAQQNLTRLNSQATPSVSATNIMQPHDAAGGVSRHMTSLELTPMASGHSAPALHTGDQPQARRFMTLLDKASQPRLNQPRHSTEHDGHEGPICASEHSALQVGSRLPSQTNVGLEPQEGVQPLHEEEEDDEAGYDEEDEDCYHELHAIPLLDPVLDRQVIMLVQTDVTPRVELENKLANLTDAQLSMLEQLFPRHIIEYMLARVPSQGGRNLRDLVNTHEQVMVLFCDVVGFTSMSKDVEARQVMHFLNELYEVFDELVGDYDMYKLDIVGDCYIVVAGLIKEDQDGFVCVDEMDSEQVINNAARILEFGKAMLAESRSILMPHNSEPVQLRIGIHTGPLVSGLVGAKMPKFTLFGDTMNTASRLESTCAVGCIHVTDTFAKLLPSEQWESTGGTHVKGKGMMQTFLHRPLAMQNLQPARSAETEHGVVTRRSSMSRMASFTSRMVGRSPSMDSRVSAAGNPLLTILNNIMGDDEGRQQGPSANQTRASIDALQGGKSVSLAPMFSVRHTKQTSPNKQLSEVGWDGIGHSPSKPIRRRPSEGFALHADKGRHPGEMRHFSKSIATAMVGQGSLSGHVSASRQGQAHSGYHDDPDSLLPMHKVALALTGGRDPLGETQRSSKSGSFAGSLRHHSLGGSLRHHSHSGALVTQAMQNLTSTEPGSSGYLSPRQIRKRSLNDPVNSSPLRGAGSLNGGISRAGSGTALIALPGLVG